MTTQFDAQFGIFDVYRSNTFDDIRGELIHSIIGLGRDVKTDLIELITKEKKEGTWKSENGNCPTYNVLVKDRLVMFADPCCGIQEM